MLVTYNDPYLSWFQSWSGVGYWHDISGTWYTNVTSQGFRSFRPEVWLYFSVFVWWWTTIFNVFILDDHFKILFITSSLILLHICYPSCRSMMTVYVKLDNRFSIKAWLRFRKPCLHVWFRHLHCQTCLEWYWWPWLSNIRDPKLKPIGRREF